MKKYILFYIIFFILISCATKPDGYDLANNLSGNKTTSYNEKIISKLNKEHLTLKQKKLWTSSIISDFKNAELFYVIEEKIILSENEVEKSLKSDCPASLADTTDFIVPVFIQLTIKQENLKKTIYKKYELKTACYAIKDWKPDQEISGIFSEAGFLADSSLDEVKNPDYNAYLDVQIYEEDPIKKFRNNKKIVTAVNERKIFIGMPEEAMLVSFGVPKNINKSVSSYLVHKQFVYGDSTYIYTENGKVTSWQY